VKSIRLKTGGTWTEKKIFEHQAGGEGSEGAIEATARKGEKTRNFQRKRYGSKSPPEKSHETKKEQKDV